MSALQAWKEDVMATNQQVKPLRSAAIKQLASIFVGRPTNVCKVTPFFHFFTVSLLQLTTSYTVNDSSYLKQKKLSVKRRQLLDA